MVLSLPLHLRSGLRRQPERPRSDRLPDERDVFCIRQLPLPRHHAFRLTSLRAVHPGDPLKVAAAQPGGACCPGLSCPDH
jgi:hypothetical protein